MNRDETLLLFLGAITIIGLIAYYYFVVRTPAAKAKASPPPLMPTSGSGVGSGNPTGLPNSLASAGALGDYVPPKDSSGIVKSFSVYCYEAVPPYEVNVGGGIQTMTVRPVKGAKVTLGNGQIGYSDATGNATFPYADLPYPNAGIKVSASAIGFKDATTYQAITDASVNQTGIQMVRSP